MKNLIKFKDTIIDTYEIIANPIGCGYAIEDNNTSSSMIMEQYFDYVDQIGIISDCLPDIEDASSFSDLSEEDFSAIEKHIKKTHRIIYEFNNDNKYYFNDCNVIILNDKNKVINTSETTVICFEDYEVVMCKENLKGVSYENC